MSELKKYQPNIVLPPELFQHVAQANIPNMEWGSNFISDYLKNWKIKRVNEFNKNRAETEEYINRAVNAFAETTITITTLGQRIEATFKEFRHRINMMEHEEELSKILIDQEKIKFQQLTFETKIEELKFKQMIKEMEDGASEP